MPQYYLFHLNEILNTKAAPYGAALCMLAVFPSGIMQLYES